MIVIDGRQSEMQLANYGNLEEVLAKLVEEESLEQRIVTDVLVNDEAFNELYPHQAEDIDAGSINRLEVRTVSLEEMAGDVVGELPKVVSIIAGGSRHCAKLLRESNLAEALELMQDVVNVSRDFLTTVQVLRGQFSSDNGAALTALGDTLGDILGEIVDVMGHEDWVLVADLLEYEYLPACERWNDIIASLSADISSAKAA